MRESVRPVPGRRERHTLCFEPGFATGTGGGRGSWLLASFLLNFLGQFWPVAERVSFLGILHYYRPLPVVRTGDWPVHDIAVLIGLAVVFFLAGMWRFSRRDIPAV